MLPTSFTPSLTTRTRELLRRRSPLLTLSHIAVGTGLNEEWIKAFNRGRFKGPSADKIETLYVYLKGSALDL